MGDGRAALLVLQSFCFRAGKRMLGHLSLPMSPAFGTGTCHKETGLGDEVPSAKNRSKPVK